MARSRPFNLTAQLNIQGPNNLRPVIANIRRQLGTLNTNLNINIDRNASRNIQNLNNQVNALNNTLRETATISQQVSANLNTISSAANNVQQNTTRANAALGNTQNTVRNLNTNIQQARDSMEDFGRQSVLAIRRFVAFSTAAAPIYALTRAISGAFEEFVKFDKEVIRLVQVTGKSKATLSGLTEEITRLSTTLGVSSSELITVSSTLAQAGLSASQTTIALEALAKASLAPSFDNLSNTVEGSIAAMRQFGISSSQLEGALGSINAVAAAFAVEAGDIIAAIQRTGGVFAAASNGVSQGTDALNEFIAVFTSVRATTRESAETIATGLRTIFTRIQRGSTIEFLRELGIQLTDVEGKFIGPFKAVEKLSSALRTLDPRDLRYSQIVEELGGFRQIGKVIPLIQQFATAQQALKVAQEGQGSLTRDAVTAQQSLANQFTKVREEFLAFVRSIGESKTFVNITKLVLGLASSLISVGKAFKPILPYLAILGAIRGTQAAVSFGRGFLGGGGGPAAPGTTTAPGGPAAPGPTGNTTATQQNILDNATVIANTNAISAQTTALGSNTTALGNVQTALNNMQTAFVNGVNALGRVITQRGAGGQTLNKGGKVLAFARGGVVPGSGNRDTVPAMLQPGEFVIRKKAVETIGANKLHKMNKYAGGGRVQKFAEGQSVRKIIEPNPELNKSHIGEDITLTKQAIQNYAKSYKSKEFFASALDNARVTKSELQSGQFDFDNLIRSMNLKAKDRVTLSLPSRWNQALRATNPDLVGKEDLAMFVADSNNQIFTGQYSRLPNTEMTQIRSKLVSMIKSLPTRRYTNKNNPPSSENPDIPTFDLDNELDSLKSIITQNNLEEASYLDLLFTPSRAGSSYISSTGQKRSRTQSRSGASKNRLGLAMGGLVQKFVDGGTVEELAAAKNMSIEKVLLEQLQALGGGAGIKQIIGAAGGSSLARKALRKDAIESGRYIKEATDLVNQALSKKGTGDAAEQARISKLTKVAVAGLMPIGYSKDFEWDLGNNNSVYANVRGLSDRYKDAVTQMQMETSTAASRFAENLQYSDIFGGGEPLAFDFDETLVSGADILGPDGKPDIPKYSDREAVSSSLKQGRLTRLGLKVKELVSSNPEFIKSTRVLTARPQNTSDLLASTLQRLGLPYAESDITGVGQDPGSTGSKKAANLGALEKLIDDNLENISAVGKAGKKGFLYNEPSPQPALDELIGQGNIEGAVIEKALALLGANLPPIEQLESNRAVDFPNGLGRAAQFFGVDPNVPTEVKRTLNSDSFERARSEFGRYFSENKFFNGGQVDPKDTLERYFQDSSSVNLGLATSKNLDKEQRKSLASDVRNLRKLKTSAPSKLYSSISRVAFDNMAQQIGLNKQPIMPEGTKYLDQEKILAKEVEKTVGKTFTLPGFISTSKNYTIAKSFLDNAPRDENNWAAMLTIATKQNAQGVDVAEQLRDRNIQLTKQDINPRNNKMETMYIDPPSKEQEVLLQPRSRFKINNAKVAKLGSHKNLWADVEQFADGGWAQHFNEGAKVRSTKNRRRGAYGARGFVPLNSKEYEAFAEKAYAEAGPYGGSDWGQSYGVPMPNTLVDYADKIQKYVFETGGAGISLGKKLVKIPDDIEPEALEALKEDLIRQYDGWYSEIEEVMPFGKELMAQTPAMVEREARTQAAARAEEENKVYTQAEDAIGIFKKTGKLSLDPSMDTYIRGTFPEYIKDLEEQLKSTTDADEKTSINRKLSKAQKAMPDYMALMSGVAVPNQGRITGLSETLYSLLDQYGSKDVSVNEIDNIMKALGSKLPDTKRFAMGGKNEDTVPALLTPGEFVINKKAASRIGEQGLNRLNKADKIAGFNKGGAVGSIQRFNIGGMPDARSSYGAGFIGSGGLDDNQSFIPLDMLANQANRLAQAQQQVIDTTNQSNDATQQLAAHTMKTNRIFAVLNTISPNLAGKFREMSDAMGGVTATIALAATTLSTQLPVLYDTLDRFAGTQLLSSGIGAGVAGGIQQAGSSTFAGINAAKQAGFGTTGTIATSAIAGIGGAISGYLQAKEQKDTENLRRALQESDARMETLFGRLEQSLAPGKRAELEQELYAEIGRADKQLGSALDNSSATMETTIGRLAEAASGLVITFAALKTAIRKSDGGIVYASKGTYVKYQPKGTDTVPAMLSPGEFVVNAKSTRKNLGLLNSINKNKGGVIGAQNLNLGGIARTVADFIPFLGSGLDIYEGIGDITKGKGALKGLGKIGMGLGFGALDLFTLGGASLLKGAAKTGGKAALKGLGKTGFGAGRRAIASGRTGTRTSVAGTMAALSGGSAPTRRAATRGTPRRAGSTAGGGTGGRAGRYIDAALFAGSALSTLPGVMGAFGGAPTDAQIERNARRGETVDRKIKAGADVEAKKMSTQDILSTLNKAGGMQEGAARDEFLTQSSTSPVVQAAEKAALAGEGIDTEVLVRARKKKEENQTDEEKKAVETATKARESLFEDSFLKTSQLDEKEKALKLQQAQKAADALKSGVALSEEQKKAYDDVYGVGRKYIAQQSEQILQTEKNNRLLKESQASAENFANAINTIEAGLQRASASFSEGMLQIDNSLGLMEGRIPKVSRLTEDIFGNLRAYKPQEIAKASGDLAKSFGFDKISTGTRVTASGVENITLGDTLKEASLATRALEVDLPRIFRENAGAVGGGDIRKQIQEGLMTGGVSEESAKTIAKEIGDRASSQTTGGKAVSFAALAQDVPGFLNSIESLKKANELQAKLIKTINDSLDTYNSKIQEAAERTVEASRIRADSARVQADFQVSLKQALGKRTTLAEETAGFDAGLRELTTIRGAGGAPVMQGTTDPVALQRRSEAAQQELNRLGQEQQAAGAGGFGDKNRDAAMKMQTEIIKKSNEALKRLAEDGSRAAAALSKVQELSQVRQARRGGIMKLLSNMDNPEAMMEQGRIMGAAQKVKGGNASLQDIQLVAQNFDEITSMMDPAMAQRFTEQFKDLVKNIPGLTEETKKFIEGAFNPQSDPAVQQAIRIAEAFKNQQIEAQKILAANLEEASKKIMDGLPAAAEEFRKIITQAAIEAANELSRQSRERLFQGGGNVPVGLAQNVVNENNISDLFETGAANINPEAFKNLLGGEQPKLDFAAIPELITSGALTGTTADGRTFKDALDVGDLDAIKTQLQTGKDFSVNIDALKTAIEENKVRFDEEQLKILTGENVISVSIQGLEALDNAKIELDLSDDIQKQLNDFLESFRRFKAEKPAALARGGVVYANKGRIIGMQPKGTDTVPAMLTPGEFVINKSATAKNLPLLKAINSGKTKGYSKGGILYAANGSMVNNVPMSEDGFKSTMDMGEGFDHLWAIDYGGELDKPQNDPNAVRKWIESALEFIRSGRNGGFDKLKSIASQTPWKQKYLEEFSLAIDDIANTDPARLAETLSSYKDSVFSQWRNPRQQAFTNFKEKTIKGYNQENTQKVSVFDLPTDPNNKTIAGPVTTAQPTPNNTGTTEVVARDIENQPWNQYAYKISTGDANIPEIWDKVENSEDFNDVPAGIALTPLSQINPDVQDSVRTETRQGDSIVAWNKLPPEKPEETEPKYNELSPDYYDELTYKEWLKKIMGMKSAPQSPIKDRFKTTALYTTKDDHFFDTRTNRRATRFDTRDNKFELETNEEGQTFTKNKKSSITTDKQPAIDILTLLKRRIEEAEIEKQKLQSSTEETKNPDPFLIAFTNAIRRMQDFNNKGYDAFINEEGMIQDNDQVYSVPGLFSRVSGLFDDTFKLNDLKPSGDFPDMAALNQAKDLFADGGAKLSGINELIGAKEVEEARQLQGLPSLQAQSPAQQIKNKASIEDARGRKDQTKTIGAKGIESQFNSAYSHYRVKLGEYNLEQRRELARGNAEQQRKQRRMADQRRRPGLYMSSGGNVPGYYADGGNIFKPRGTDTVPAMLTPGEFVVNRKSTQANLGLLHQINKNSGTKYYQKGGQVSYLAAGGTANGSMGIDFSPFMDGVTQFSTYVNDFTTAVNDIPTWDFSEFTRGITTFSNAIAVLTGSLGPINTAAAAFGTATQNISQAVAALANIPTTITINGRIDMPTQIVVTVEGNTAGADTTALTKEIINKVALGLSQGNPQINVSSLLNQT
jgi:TP901 family phage tail tape measure protein